MIPINRLKLFMPRQLKRKKCFFEKLTNFITQSMVKPNSVKFTKVIGQLAKSAAKGMRERANERIVMGPRNHLKVCLVFQHWIDGVINMFSMETICHFVFYFRKVN